MRARNSETRFRACGPIERDPLTRLYAISKYELAAVVTNVGSAGHAGRCVNGVLPALGVPRVWPSENV